MATRERMAWVSGMARLQGRLGRWARSAPTKALIVLALIIAAAAVGMAAWTTQTPPGSHYLAGGRRFYSDDLIKICRALDEQRIDYRQDDHRIEVDADQFDQAAQVIAKLDVGRRTIEELRGPGGAWSVLLETTEDRRRRELLGRERILESLISQQEGVVWSLVSLHSGPLPGRRSATRSAFVYVETEGNQKLPSRTVQLLPTLLSGYLPDLAPRSITLMDRGGRRYLDPSDPNLGELSRNEAREEEIGDQIRERLDWIKGVRVLAKVAPAPPPIPKPMITAAETAIVVNQPATLESSVPDPRPADPHPEGGRVQVSVPRSFYYDAIVNRGDRKEPSIEELRQLAARTEGQIRSTVELITAGQGAWSVDVETIPDEFHEHHPLAATTGTEARRRGLDLNLVTAVAAGLSIVTALGAWIRAARRPAPTPEPRPLKRVHQAEQSAPSERVRELVRRDPQAAASVIERWMTQGDSNP